MILAAFAVAALLSAALLALLARRLPADFLAAAVTARSNHAGAARQIGGLAAVPATIATLALAWIAGAPVAWPLLAGTLGAAALLWLVGYRDDHHDLGVAPRLAAQAAAALLVILVLPDSLRVLPQAVPLAAERALEAVALVYVVNMVNFMDGLDLMVVSGVGLPHALIALAGVAGLVDPAAALAAAAVAGGLAGFAPFNRPPARVFLGDSGSLAIGLLTGVVLLLLAAQALWLAALPFLFFLADSLSTLALRSLRGENLLAAHSGHAYQRARRAGRSVRSIVGEVALVSALAAALGAAALADGRAAGGWLALAVAAGVALLSLARMRRAATAAGVP